MPDLKNRVGSNLGGILARAGVLAIAQVANAGLAYGVQLALARWMSVTHYGWYAFGWAIATLAAIPAAVGLPQASLRFIPEYAATNDHRSLDSFIRWSRRCVVAAGFGIAILSIGMIEIYHGHVGGPRQPHLYLAFVLVPLLALSNLHVRQSHSFGWPTKAYLPQVLFAHLGLLIAAGIAVWSGVRLTAQSALSALLLLYVLTVFTQRVLLERGHTTAEGSRPQYRLWLRVALPLLISGAAYIVLERTDLIMIGLMLGPHEVAVYNAAAKTALLVSFVVTAIGSMAAPRFASLYTEGQQEELQALVVGIIRWSLLPSLALFALLVVLGRPLLGLFGEAYTAGYPFLIVLAGVQSLAALVGPAHHLLNVTGHESITAWGLGLTALANLLLNALLIPRFGLWGAAAATALSLSAWYILLPILAWRHVGIYSFALGSPVRSQRGESIDDG